MNRRTKFSRYLSNWSIFVIVMVGVYAFLSVVNWELSIGEWGGFSRFVLASAGLVFFLWTVSDNHEIAEKYRIDKVWEKKIKKDK